MSKPGNGLWSVGILGLMSAGLSWSGCRAAELNLYGVGHLSYDAIDTGASSSDYVHSNSSRLGIKGAQDLDDGLTIYVQYESGVDLTVHGTGDGNGGANSAGQVFTRARDSFLGVKSDYGSIQFGRVGGMNQWLYDYNLFGDQVGDLGNIWGGDGLPGRIDSAAEYISPTFSGFRVAVTYVPNQGGHNQHDEVVKADYAVGGGFKLGAGYAKFGGGGVGIPTLEAGALTASYEADLFNVGGEFQHEKNVGGASGADRNQATFGAAVKLGKSAVVKAQYTWSGELTGVSQSGASQFAAGLDYNLGTSTTVYLAYAHVSNSALNAYSSFDYGHGDEGTPAILAGKSPAAYSIGLIYKFDVSIIKGLTRS